MIWKVWKIGDKESLNLAVYFIVYNFRLIESLKVKFSTQFLNELLLFMKQQ